MSRSGDLPPAASATPFRYRPDIDALRGLAVLAVLITHLDSRLLPGGFSGVDIFFVISGYVVTGSLLAHGHEPPWRRLGGFYLRRIRRLLPNLLACLGLTALAVALLVPPGGSGPAYVTASKALFGWSNNQLLGQTDYFAQDAKLNPFLHTWSLGVEEQFYLLFPLLLILCGFSRRRTLPLLSLLALASLLASLWWSHSQPSAGFYLMPSRFWELASGGLLLLAERNGLLGKHGRGRHWRLAGAALLLLALVGTREGQGFPAPGAFPAVAGTLLVLRAGTDPAGRFLPGRWLERLLIGLGLISYSLYLWHWPVITLQRWTIGIDQPAQKLLALGLSLLLALLAWALVERPLRRLVLPTPWQASLAVVALLATWAGIDSLAGPGRGRLFIGSDPDPVPFAERINELNPTIPGSRMNSECGVPPGARGSANRADLERCSRPGRPGAGEIAVIGDSHAQHLLPMLDRATRTSGQRLSLSFKSACLIDPTLTTSWQNQPYDDCRAFAAAEMERLTQRLRPGDVVLLSQFLYHHLGLGETPVQGVSVGGRSVDAETLRRVWLANLRGWARRLGERDIALVLVQDVPVLAREPQACGWSRRLRGAELSSRCAASAERTAASQRRLSDLLAQAAAGLANVHVFDPTPWLLGPDGRVRHHRADGTPLYADSNHLSLSGSHSLAEPFRRFLIRERLLRSVPRDNGRAAR